MSVGMPVISLAEVENFPRVSPEDTSEDETMSSLGTQEISMDQVSTSSTPLHGWYSTNSLLNISVKYTCSMLGS